MSHSYLAKDEYSNGVYQESVRFTRLLAVIDLWAPIEKLLGITTKHAIDFVEQHLSEFSTPIYVNDERTGRWRQAEDSRRVLFDLWEAAQNEGWERARLSDWEFVRIAPADSDRVIGEAERIAKSEPCAKLEFAAGEATSDGSAQTELWPWGNHETTALRHLAAAARKWWANFDPADNTTAPTNEQVSEWLQARGVSKRMADTMASILRADGLPTGPRT